MDAMETAKKITQRFVDKGGVKFTYTNDLAMDAMLQVELITGYVEMRHHVKKIMKERGFEPWSVIPYTSQPFVHVNYMLSVVTEEPLYKKPFIEESEKYFSEVTRSEEGAIAHYPDKPGRNLLIDMLQDYTARMARTGLLTGEEKYYKECVQQFRIYRDILRDPETGLWSNGRGWLEDPMELSPGAWSRGHGWLIRGMIDSLCALPPESEYAKELTGYLEELADALLAVQDEKGMWHQLLHLPHEKSYPDSTGTGLICFGLAKALDRGFLTDLKYRDAALLAWEGMTEYITDEGIIKGCCPGPGPLESIDPYLDTPGKDEDGENHGPGCAIYACAGKILLDRMNIVNAFEYDESVETSDDYQVWVNNKPVPVLTTSCADFVHLEFEGTIEVLIKVDCDDRRFFPASAGIMCHTAKNTYWFTTSKPRDFCFEPNRGKPIFFYFDAPETDIPGPEDENVLYYKTGKIYEEGLVELQSGQTVYIEGGAVVRGAFRAKEKENITIRGRGVLDNSCFTRKKDGQHPLAFNRCRNLNVKDITIINPSRWTTVYRGCEDIHINGLHEIGEGNGSDGIDIVSCRNVLIENCTLRNGDDCIVIKGGQSWREEDYIKEPFDVDNVEVRGCMVYNSGGGSALEIGHELRTEHIKNITFRDCDIIGVHGWGAALSIANAEFAEVSDILYEDIRVEHYFTYLMNFRVLKTRWSKTPDMGTIKNVTVRNLKVTHPDPDLNQGYSISLIGGLSPEHGAKDITLENITINGRKIETAEELELFTRHAENVVFK